MKTYTVSLGDTLPKISQKVYGSPAYATTIYLANRARISDPNQLTPLQLIAIPELTLEQADEALKREIFNA
jgi:nucleoid-associated protein YgaU